MNDKQLSKAATKGGKIVSLLYFKQCHSCQCIMGNCLILTCGHLTSCSLKTTRTKKKVTLEYLYLLKQDNTLSVCPAVEEVEVLHQWSRKQVLPRLDCKWI